MAITNHDAHRQISSASLSFNSAGGSNAQSSSFTSQTYWIRISFAGQGSTGFTGVRYKVGDNPTATSTSTLLPINRYETVKCTPGQKVAALSDSTGTGSINVVELTD